MSSDGIVADTSVFFSSMHGKLFWNLHAYMHSYHQNWNQQYLSELVLTINGTKQIA
jgi:hypothetical protein